MDVWQQGKNLRGGGISISKIYYIAKNDASWSVARDVSLFERLILDAEEVVEFYERSTIREQLGNILDEFQGKDWGLCARAYRANSKFISVLVSHNVYCRFVLRQHIHKRLMHV